MRSPFKFLDAYTRQDNELFFGRTNDIDRLYSLVFQSKLLLVYGQSGTGKTSLIQCGLANRFKQTDWFDIFVRRKENINASLDREIRRLAETPIPERVTVADAVRSLYLDHLRPIYFIFDQFEELFILGSKEEQHAFYRTVSNLLTADVACKIILVMREEYIGVMNEFEREVPSLFNKRFRVESMSPSNVQQVVTGTVAAFGIGLERGDATARQIITNLHDERTGVQLSYLQVYLDRLYREATEGETDSARGPAGVLFTDRLVERVGGLGDVMADFLDRQTASIQKTISTTYPAAKPDIIQAILEQFVTLEGTKQTVHRADLAATLRQPQYIVDAALSALENCRLLRTMDGESELAHDTVATHIAAKRTVEQKTLMKVQKLIRDRYTAFSETHTYLGRQELAFCAPYLDHLTLSDAERKFLDNSKKKLTWGQRKRLGFSLASVIIIMATLGYFYAEQKQRAVSQRYQRDLALANDSLVSFERAAGEAADAAEKKLLELSFYLKQDLEALPASNPVRIRSVERLQHYIPDAPAHNVPIILSGNNRDLLHLSGAIALHDKTYPLDLLKEIIPRAAEEDIRKFIIAFNTSVYAKSINTPRRFAAFMAVVSALSDEFNYMEVSTDFSEQQLRSRFPHVFRNLDSIHLYKHNPERAANLIYANVQGNGNEDSGDGWRYRPRGLIKMWSKSRYLKYTAYSGYDLLRHPEWLSAVDVATAISCIAWTKVLNRKHLNALADERDFASIADHIAPFAENDIKDIRARMIKYYEQCCTVLKVQ